MDSIELRGAVGFRLEEDPDLPRTVEVRRNHLGNRYRTRVFESKHALPAALRYLGGWAELAVQIEESKEKRRRLEEDAREEERRREDLQERRKVAAARRRARLDAWFAAGASSPAGRADVDSFDAWVASLAARGGASSPYEDAVIRGFLSDATLKSPSLKAVKEAVVRLEKCVPPDCQQHATASTLH